MIPPRTGAIAVHVSNCTAILPMVLHLSLFTFLIATPQPLLLSVLLPSQKPRTDFQFSVLFPFSTVIFRFISAPRFAKWSASRVFTENVSYTIVDLGDGIRHLFLPPRMQRFLNVTNFPSVFSHNAMTIDPFFGTFGVPTQLNRWSFFASVNGSAREPHSSWFFTVCFLLFLICALSNVGHSLEQS